MESIVAIVKVMISVQNDVVIDPHYNKANERNMTFLNPIGKVNKIAKRHFFCPNCITVAFDVRAPICRYFMKKGTFVSAYFSISLSKNT